MLFYCTTVVCCEVYYLNRKKGQHTYKTQNRYVYCTFNERKI